MGQGVARTPLTGFWGFLRNTCAQGFFARVQLFQRLGPQRFAARQEVAMQGRAEIEFGEVRGARRGQLTIATSRARIRIRRKETRRNERARASARAQRSWPGAMATLRGHAGASGCRGRCGATACSREREHGTRAGHEQEEKPKNQVMCFRNSRLPRAGETHNRTEMG